MKQIVQDLKTGKTYIENIPVPHIVKGHLLIKTNRSLVSLGTERMLVEFGKASYLGKARQQPEKVKQVLDKIKTEGLFPTIESVINKLEQPLPLGYCNVGEVIEVGEGVNGLQVGDRVVSNGNHAEFVSVPQNLVSKIPEAVTDDEAVFTVLGSIGLQGIRLLNPTFGETIVVSGLGLIGLITAELLMANGCRVIGLDVDDAKVQLAREKGIEALNLRNSSNPIGSVLQLNRGIGVDGVVITAATKSNELISQAAQMCRKRGRIILIGVIGLNLNRSDFYEKELTFQVSCSYGPGRYDSDYEQKGNDYPLSFVRWTEKRNFESILFAISTGKIDVKPLISKTVEFDEFSSVYQNLDDSNSVGIILRYPMQSSYDRTIRVCEKSFNRASGVIGIMGAGNFTKATILPTLKASQAKIKYISSANGLNAGAMAKKYGIGFSTSDNSAILNDEEVGLVLITTRHNQHAEMVIKAIKSGKHVFVEKPLALKQVELEEIIECYDNANVSLTVGFNRRFSPHANKIKELVGSNQVNIIANMNAGFIPEDSWVQDLEIGGGRIIGEACHFIDLITYITGSRVVSVCMNALGVSPQANTDNASILLKYENGSTGVINYFSNGSKSYSKERVEVYFQQRTLILDNFRTLSGYGFKGFKKLSTRLDKGHKAQFKKLIESLESGESIIPFEEIVNTTRSSFAALESLKTNSWINVK